MIGLPIAHLKILFSTSEKNEPHEESLYYDRRRSHPDQGNMEFYSRKNENFEVVAEGRNGEKSDRAGKR